MLELEIYIRADPLPIQRWLRSLCTSDPTLVTRSEGRMVTRSSDCVLRADDVSEPDAQPRTQVGYPAHVLIVDDVGDGFGCVSFSGANLPWPDDLHCARAAARTLGCEVRCNSAAWRPGDDEDAGWCAITADGEREIRWRSA